MKKSSNNSSLRLKDNYQYLSGIFDQHIGNKYYEYLRDQFKKICNGLVSKAKHLDVGCGTGDLIEYSHSLGLNVRGIDISPAMVKLAREKLNYEIDISCKSIFDISYNHFNIITANNDVLNYLAVDHSLASIFNQISKLLTKDGIFYGDVVSDNDILENWEESGHTYTDSKTFRCHVNYKVQNHNIPIGEVKREWEIQENDKWGGKESEIEVLKGISIDEILSASEKNNFSVRLSKFPNGNIEMLLLKN